MEPLNLSRVYIAIYKHESKLFIRKLGCHLYPCTSMESPASRARGAKSAGVRLTSNLSSSYLGVLLLMDTSGIFKYVQPIYIYNIILILIIIIIHLGS